MYPEHNVQYDSLLQCGAKHNLHWSY